MDVDYLATELLNSLSILNTEQILNRLKLTYKGENVILALLVEFGGSGTPGNLCKRVDFTAARLSAIIKSLESKGLVERIQNKDDKRSTIVAMTSQGYDYFSALQVEVLRNALTVIKNLGEEDAEEFLRIINRLIVIANSMEEA